MTMDTSIGTRVDRLETGVTTLTTKFAGFEVTQASLSTGQNAIMAKLDEQDRTRPGISAIWVPLGSLVAMMSLIGGAVAVPQLARLATLEQLAHERQPRIEENRTDVAILCHDAQLAGRGCQH